MVLITISTCMLRAAKSPIANLAPSEKIAASDLPLHRCAVCVACICHVHIPVG